MSKQNQNAITHLRKDPVLVRCIDSISLEFDDEYVDVFIYLVRSIISQQLSTTVAATIYNRLIDHDEIDPFDPHSFLSVSDDELRALGLSYQKAKYVKNVSRYFIDRNVTLDQWKKMESDEIIKELTQIKGVGVWTVQMVLMFALHRSDIFPDGDLGIQLGMKSLYGIEKEKKELKIEMNRIAEEWSPYRTLACRYIWRYKDLE